MEKGIKKINDVLDYIETHIFDDITCKEMARIALLSEYEFRRIFSFMLGMPIGEYVRRRRLTLAAEALKTGTATVSDMSIRCGYDAPSSFSRAFKEMFGVSPSEAKNTDRKLAVLVKPRLAVTVQGGVVMSYTERSLATFTIKGVCGESLLNDTCCCESVWNEFEKTELANTLSCVYAAYVNGSENVICYIGEKVEGSKTGGDGLVIEGGKWICFELESSAPEKEINDLYEKIVYSFLPSSIYKRDEKRPNVEVFDENGSFLIMIPVCVEKRCL